MIREYLHEIIQRIARNTLKTVLMSFGVFWGVFMLIVLLAAGKGIENGFRTSHQDNLHATVSFRGGQTALGYLGHGKKRPIILTERSAELLKRVDGFQHLAYEKQPRELSSLKYQKNSGRYPTTAVSSDFFAAKGTIRITAGRWLNPLDYQQGRKSVVIPQKILSRIMPDIERHTLSTVIGTIVQLDGLAFRIAGTYEDTDKNPDIQQRLYIADSTYRQIYSNQTSVTRILAALAHAADTRILIAEARQQLYRLHGIHPQDQSAIYVDGTADAARNSHSVFTAIRLFIWIVGVGTLISGMVGVSNIMNIAIKERTNEIGLRKAIGEKSKHILASTITESLLITSIAGLAGLLLGKASTSLMGYLSSIPGVGLSYFNNPSVGTLVAVGSLVALVVSGLVAGLIPAMKTVAISPVEAMKSR